MMAPRLRVMMPRFTTPFTLIAADVLARLKFARTRWRWFRCAAAACDLAISAAELMIFAAIVFFFAAIFFAMAPAFTPRVISPAL